MQTTRLPSATGPALHDAGHYWDAIRVPRSVGLSAMAILGARCGAVVQDRSVLYLFVRVGTAAEWDVENTRALGAGASITIPPPRRAEGPGPYWRMCPGDGGWLTDPDVLRAAIADAFGPRLGEEQGETA
ncbi:hypothetical protein GA0115233_101914 [Streptomyces sp. DI166]|uniref:hypothetical protein n=1 Tax=Streptomyces sp. DI166 TaxID=1839783 RepID=UPI0007F4C870|nr:hypothetical protein [Streptomyces sp. DI166]SBT90468.1 hypothetical protein GA0115233_101914 [Streptomyces sp. DI166]